MPYHLYQLTIVEIDDDASDKFPYIDVLKLINLLAVDCPSPRCTGTVAVSRVGFGAKIKLIRIIPVLRQIFEVVARTPKIFYFTQIAINNLSR